MPTGSVSGYVRKKDGTPISDESQHMVWELGGVTQDDLNTDPNGRYATTLEYGTYSVYVNGCLAKPATYQVCAAFATRNFRRTCTVNGQPE